MCLACPGGKYVTGTGASICTDCPVGRFVNHTGEGIRCLECPRGRSTNGRTGLRQCIRCSTNNDRFRGGSFFFQDEVGQPQCKLCESSGTVGGMNCNERTGNTEFGDCWGLYTFDSDCKEAQSIYQSVGIAYSMFFVTCLVLLPFVFVSGGLASVAQVWRRDIGIIAIWMCRTTTKTYELMTVRFDQQMRQRRERNLRKYFGDLSRRQEPLVALKSTTTGIPLIAVDDSLGADLHAHIGLGSKRFVGILTRALANRTSNASWSLSYDQFRLFLSLLVQRRAVASDALRFRLIFEVVAVHRTFIERYELRRLSHAAGSPPFDEHDLGIVRAHTNPLNGKLDAVGFTKAMFCIATEAKVQHLIREMDIKAAKIRSAFIKHARGDDSHACLDLAGFQACCIELGLAWSVEIIRQIKHAAKQLEAGAPIPLRCNAVCQLLKVLDSGVWSWLVVLPLVFLALLYGDQHVSAFDLTVCLVLSGAVFVRLGCHVARDRTFTCNCHNACDAVSSAIDTTFALMVIFRAPMRSEQGLVTALRFARLIRLVPVAKAILPRHILVRCSQKEGEAASTTETARFRVTYAEFRAFVSASKLDEARDRPVWPSAVYRQAFLDFDKVFETHSGTVQLGHFAELVQATGHWPTEYQLAKMKQVVAGENQNENACVYFDCFVSAMSLVRDEAVESGLLASFESDEDRCWRTRMYIAKQALIGALLVVVVFVGAIIKLATNIYVLAQATFGTNKVEVKLLSYIGGLTDLALSLRRSSALLSHFVMSLVFVLKVCFAFLFWLSQFFQFVRVYTEPNFTLFLNMLTTPAFSLFSPTGLYQGGRWCGLQRCPKSHVLSDDYYYRGHGRRSL